MESVAKIGFAFFGAVGGFVLGLILAASFGLHEKVHVMSVALLSALALAVVGLRLASTSASTAKSKTARAGLAIGGIIIAACSFVFLLFLVGY